jgi:hypothetical protein
MVKSKKSPGVGFPSVSVPVSVRVLVLAEELKGVLELLLVSLALLVVAALLLLPKSDRELDKEDNKLSELATPFSSSDGFTAAAAMAASSSIAAATVVEDSGRSPSARVSAEINFVQNVDRFTSLLSSRKVVEFIRISQIAIKLVTEFIKI